MMNDTHTLICTVLDVKRRVAHFTLVAGENPCAMRVQNDMIVRKTPFTICTLSCKPAKLRIFYIQRRNQLLLINSDIISLHACKYINFAVCADRERRSHERYYKIKEDMKNTHKHTLTKKLANDDERKPKNERRRKNMRITVATLQKKTKKQKK